MNSESTYWIFSTAAQSIAALIAFLLTGYTYKINSLNQKLKDDDTLAEIAPIQKKEYNDFFKLLLFSGVSAIISNIYMLYIPSEDVVKKMAFPHIFSGAISFFTIVLSFIFIWILLDEKREGKIAKGIAKEIYPKKFPKKPKDRDEKGRKIEFYDFMSKFVGFEERINRIIKEEGLFGKTLTGKVYLLSKKGILKKETFMRIKELITYRNLLVHKGVSFVDYNFMNLIDTIMDEIKLL